MLTPFVLIFIFMLIFSSIISISSSTWLGVWLGLEVNLMSFIPLVAYLGSGSNSEGLLKYFLVQAFSSILFLMAVIMLLYNTTFILSCTQGWFNIIYFMLVPLMIKLGAAPFHFWFPAVASGLDWISNFILMTWQKLVPLILVCYMMYLNYFIITILILSAMVGSVGGLNQTSLRKLMAYSSINHLSWMLISGNFGTSLVMFYYLIYSLTSLIVVMMFFTMNLFYLSQLYYMNGSFSLTLLFINLFSFGGLPPFLGFAPKWFVLESMMNYSLDLLSLILVMMSLLSLFYYIRLGYAIYTQSNMINPLFVGSMTVGPMVMTVTVVNLVGLVLLPLFMILI